MSLKDLKIQAFTEPVSDLPDNPSQSGITAEELKRRFDANANNELKPSVNGIVDFLLGFTDGEEIKGIRLNSDNVIEVTTDGKNYISTGYSKTYITQLLAEKVDKSDVLLKTNTEEFTPTGIYQPATKKYVDDKVVSAGAADMTQAVYDPTGRQTDIFAEVDKKLDKTGGTIDGDVEISGDLDLTGGIAKIDRVNINGQLQLENNSALMLYGETRDGAQISKTTYYDDDDGEDFGLALIDNNGLKVASLRVCASEEQVIAETTNLNVKANYPHFLLTNDVYSRNLDVYFTSGTGASNGGILAFRNTLDNDNSTTLFFHPEFTTAPNNLLRCQIKKSGKSSFSNIFGQHNKPTGSYTGNGSSSARTVQVGGLGDVLLVRAGRKCYFISADGYYSANSNDTTATFIDGVLTILGGTNLNDGNQTYYYQVL